MLLTITPDDFSQLWQITAERPTHSIADLALADSVLAKLEALGSAEMEADERGDPTATVRRYVLESGTVDLTLSDAEAVFLRDRIEKELRRGQTRENRGLLSLATPIDVEAARVITERRAAERAAERETQLARAEAAIDEELVAKQSELDQVRTALGTARTELEGVLAELDAQQEAVR